MEVIERLIYLYHKFHQLKVSNEEYACMKAINFLNQGEWLGCGKKGPFFGSEHFPLCFLPPFTLRTVTQNVTPHMGTSLSGPIIIVPLCSAGHALGFFFKPKCHSLYNS